MKHVGLAMGSALALVLGAAVDARAEDRPARAPAPSSAPTPVPLPAEKISRPTVAASARPPLSLHVGDIRKYMMPNEYLAAVGAPDADKYTVVVQGQRVLLPMKSEQPVPVGIVTPFWMLAHPLSAWRALVPDLRAPPPGPPDPVPQREFRWGP